MELHIGKPVKAKATPRGQYVLVVEHMHGDADAYTKTKHSFKADQVPALLAYLAFLDRLESGVSDVDEEFEKVWPPFVGKGLGEDMLEGDCTTDHSSSAFPELKKLTWFDDDGVEHEVKIKK